MAFVEDLTQFFKDFGVPATLVGAPLPITVIFDRAYVAALSSLVESTGPCCLAMDDDLAGVTHGTSMTIKSVAYKVAGIEPDGTGLSILHLRT